MKIFLDSAHIDEIREVATWGILDGVTTNPSHVAKTGANPRDLYPEICSLVDGPVSLEAVSMDAEGIIAEARELTAISDNVIVKVPLVKEGLIATRQLSSEGIRTNLTANYSVPQALLAAKAGATYVSPFVGRLDNTGVDGMELVEQIRQIYDNYGYPTEIIVAAVRNPLHVVRAGLCGADICTMNFEVLNMLLDHPLTDATLEGFLADWEKVPKGSAAEELVSSLTKGGGAK
jgi:transaldolase